LLTYSDPLIQWLTTLLINFSQLLEGESRALALIN
jgi:hypothetical protein